MSLAHRARLDHLKGARGDQWLRVAGAERREPREIGGRFEREIFGRRLRVARCCGPGPPLAEPRQSRALERFAKRAYGARFDREAAGRRVAAEADERMAACRQQLVQVHTVDRSRRAPTERAIERDHRRRFAETLDQLGRHDPDDARVPAFSRGEYERPRGAAGAFDLRHGRGGDGLLDRLSFAVALVTEARAVLAGRLVLGQQTLERWARLAQAPGRVEARREAEGDVARADLSRQLGAGQQRAQARAAAFAERAQAVRDEDAVLANQRRHVGDRAERDQIEQRAWIGRRVAPADPRPQRGAKIERQPRRA